MAPQSFRVAVVAWRSVVATTLKFGNEPTAFSIIFLKEDGSRREADRSSPSTSKPRAAVKSSSLPSITSTRGASSRFTSRARFWPPIVFQSEAR